MTRKSKSPKRGKAVREPKAEAAAPVLAVRPVTSPRARVRGRGRGTR